MKKFIYSLQPLLGVKRTLEQQQKNELASAEARLQDLKQTLANIKTRFEIRRTEFTNKLKEGMIPYDITAYAIGFEALRDKEKRQLLKIDEQAEEVNRIRGELIETMRERKMLENLRERHYSEYLEEVKRENEKIIGDFVANKLAMTSIGGDKNG